ncbi:MAG: outer membrane protein assembly factor BamC [Gallionella sp.]
MKVLQIGISGVVLVLLVSCSSLTSDKKIDYRAAAKQVPKLEVPPDLTSPEADERYKMPGSGASPVPGTAEGVATYSDYSKGGVVQGRVTVLPDVPGVSLERDGARRWLVVSDKPEKVWSVVKTFWQENGLVIKFEEQAAGVMETDWAENHAKIPQSPMRNVLGNMFDNSYSSGERDQYLTRLERSKDGKSTEVHISHRGIVEVYPEDKASAKWLARANDPELEAVMLQRLMVRFGASETQAASAVIETGVMAAASSASPTSVPEPAGSASLREFSGGNVIIAVNDPFDRSWRRVGLAIESAGLGVEDKDREKGTYFLRPLKVQSGWLESLKFWKPSEQAGKNFRVNIKDGGAACEVSVTDQDGANSKVTRQLTEEIYKYINQ